MYPPPVQGRKYGKQRGENTDLIMAPSWKGPILVPNNVPGIIYLGEGLADDTVDPTQTVGPTCINGDEKGVWGGRPWEGRSLGT